jgi:hypothetical protein
MSDDKESNVKEIFAIDKSTIRDSNLIIDGQTFRLKQVTLINYDTMDYFLCTGKFGILNIGFFEAIDSLGSPVYNLSNYYGCNFKKLTVGNSIPLLINNHRNFRTFEPAIELYTDTIKLTSVFFKDSLTF